MEAYANWKVSFIMKTNKYIDYTNIIVKGNAILAHNIWHLYILASSLSDEVCLTCAQIEKLSNIDEKA